MLSGPRRLMAPGTTPASRTRSCGYPKFMWKSELPGQQPPARRALRRLWPASGAYERAHLHALVSVCLVDHHTVTSVCVIPAVRCRPGRVDRRPNAAQPCAQRFLNTGSFNGHRELGAVIGGVGVSRVVQQRTVAGVELRELLDHKVNVVPQLTFVAGYLDGDVHPVLHRLRLPYQHPVP